jgi:hypothetical protein
LGAIKEIALGHGSLSCMSEGVWPSPRRMKSWTDSDGRVWRRVGDQPLARKQGQRIVRDREARVVLFNGLQPTDVDPDARDGLWARVDAVLNGRASDNPMADFVLFKYRDESGKVMLAVEESC